jgi:hypothetical protein
VDANDAGFTALLQQARADPDVLGVVLSGSRVHGTPTPLSDYDVRLILRDEADAAGSRYDAARFPHVDLRVMPLRDFVPYADWDTPFAWDRYSFAHAQVLLDRTGIIKSLVAEKGRLAPAQQAAFVGGALDAFLNSVYRADKCSRTGNTLCARIEATEAVQHGLAVLFGLEGRLRPYPVALAQELRQFPLQQVRADALLGVLTAVVETGDQAALQHLVALILTRARAAGYDDVIDAWGARIADLGPAPPE